MIADNISRKVLTIGVDYHNPRGGIAQVINVYSTIFSPFNFIRTTVCGNKLTNLFVLIIALCRFIGYMLFSDVKIVHIHTASYISFWRKRIFINLAKLFKRKVVLHVHGGEFKIFSEKNYSKIKRTITKCDCIIALSIEWKMYFEDSYLHPNVQIIKNIIESPTIKTEINKDKKYYLLFLGKLGEKKGIYDLLDVLSENKKKYQENLIFLYGGNGEVEKVSQYVKDKCIESMAVFQGWVTGEKKVSLLNQANAYILPSYNEGLPISILEAMSYSLPIISTNVGGIPEIVKNGINGYLFDAGDKTAMAQAIDALMENREQNKEFGKNSLKIVQEHLPESVAKQLTELYQKTLML